MLPTIPPSIDAISSKLSINHIGLFHYFLEIEAIPTSQGLFLSQHKRICNLLEKMKVADTNECVTPMATSLMLFADGSSSTLDPTLYRSTIDAFQYL